MNDPIHKYFGLSYAAYIVIPRSILQSCSVKAQLRLIDALDAIQKEAQDGMKDDWPGDRGIVVQLKDKKTKRFVKDELQDYQRGRRRLW